MPILDGLRWRQTKRQHSRRGRPDTFFRPWGEALEDRNLLSTLLVTQLGDSGPGSLRQAVLDANNEVTHPGADTITFDPALVAAGPAMVALTTAGDLTAGPSALGISSTVTIAGPSGLNGITLARSAGAGNMRLFYVAPSGTLTLQDLTLTGGVAQG